jgi:uncharacterized protein (DUF433 family)
MLALNTSEVVALTTDAEGVARVGGTRVTLDTVVGAFYDGATPEDIVEQYPTLALADVYQVLGFVLRHTEETDQYLRERRQYAEHVRRENETRFAPHGIRQRLMNRRLLSVSPAYAPTGGR